MTVYTSGLPVDVHIEARKYNLKLNPVTDFLDRQNLVRGIP